MKSLGGTEVHTSPVSEAGERLRGDRGGLWGSSLGTGGDSEGLRRGPRPPGMASSTTRDPPTNLHTLHTCTSRLHQMELHTMRSSRTSTSRLYASLHNLQMESFQNSERGYFQLWFNSVVREF